METTIKISESTKKLVAAKKHLDVAQSFINSVAEQLTSEEDFIGLYQSLAQVHCELHKVIGINAGRIMDETNFTEL